MAKFSVSFDDARVTIINDTTNKVDGKFDLLEHVELSTAFRVLTAGRKADEKASDVAISMLADVMQSPILDEYKGKTPANEKVPSVFLSAIRDIENELFKPEFIKAHMARGATAGKADALWQDFRKNELTTGSYSNAKSFVCKLYAHVGQLPIAPNGKLLPLFAIRRMLDSWKSQQETMSADNEGISQRIVSLSLEIEQRTEKTKIGNVHSAIAALKSLLATYEGLAREQTEREQEQAMMQHAAQTLGHVNPEPTPAIDDTAGAIINKARGKRKAKPKALEDALL